MPRNIQFWFAWLSAAAVIAGVSVILYATAHMNAGHPPASGIVALFAVLVITPISGLRLITAAIDRRKQALYFLLLGINLLYMIVFARI